MKHATLIVFLIALLAASTAYLLHRIQGVQHHQNDALHSIICFSEGYIHSSKKLTVEQKSQDIHLYNRMIQRAHLAPCTTNQGGR